MCPIDCKQYKTQHLLLVDDDYPYQHDPDYGFESASSTFSKKLRQRRHWNEACVLEKDTPLNKVLANVIVDLWQHNINSFSQTSQDKPEDEFHENGPQESLATEVEERFVNALIMRTREADYVPLTNNLGLNYKRRTLYFPMDSDYLNLDDGLVDTGALSSAIQEANLPKIR